MKNKKNKNSYPGCMMTGLGDSESSSVLLLSFFEFTATFFPLPDSTGISFLVLQHINMIDDFRLR